MTKSLKSLDSAALHKLAEGYLSRGQWTDAIDVLEKMAKLQPARPEIWATLGSAQVDAGQHERGRANLKKALGLSKERPHEWLASLAKALCLLGRESEALPLLAEAFEGGSRHFATMILYAKCLEVANARERATAVLCEAADRYPSNFEIQVIAARDLMTDGRQAEALPLAERALALQPHDLGVGMMVATIRQGLGDHSGAATLFLKLATAKPEDARIRERWSQNFERAHGAATNSALRDLVRENPDSKPLRFDLVRRAIEAGELDEAQDVLNALHAAAPGSAAVREARARLALARGEIAEAIGHFEVLWDEAAIRKVPSPLPTVTKVKKRTARLVYMPVEIKSRELAARVATACFLAQRGFGSIIGATRVLTEAASEVPLGTFLHKTLNNIDRGKIEQTLAAGHLNAALDEEALGWTGASWGMVCDVDPAITPLVDRVFVPGERGAAAFAECFPEAALKVRVTGNPRIDMLSDSMIPELDAEKAAIQAEYGRFVLICTNFGGVNAANFSYKTFCDHFLRVVNKSTGNDSAEAALEMGKSTARSECEYIVALEKVLLDVSARLPDATFVIRSHPGESQVHWERLAARRPNIRMSGPGSLQAWLRAAETTIYMSGCTTGLEAFLAGVPAIRFETNPSLTFPAWGISAHVNPAASNAQELADLIASRAAVDPATRAREVAFVDTHIVSGGEWAASRIAREIVELAEPNLDSRPIDPIQYREQIADAIVKAQRAVDRAAAFNTFIDAKRVIIGDAELNDMLAQICRSYDIAQMPQIARLGPEAIMLSPPA